MSEPKLPKLSSPNIGYGISPGLEEAIRLRKEARTGPPTEADVPPLSLFPMTPAARAAKALRKAELRRRA